MEAALYHNIPQRHPWFCSSRVMLAVLFFALFLPLITNKALAAPTCTTACYVSTTGSNTNSGVDAANALATINTAIGQVSSGGTVYLLAGTYTQSATINKPLTLIGAGQGADPLSNTIIQGSATGNGISLASGANNVTIQALRITNFTTGINRQGAFATNNVVVEDVTAISNQTAGFAFSLNGPVRNIRLSRVTGNNSTEPPSVAGSSSRAWIKSRL